MANTLYCHETQRNSLTIVDNSFSMTGITLFLLIAVLGLVLLWLDTTEARDHARGQARRACEDLRVQFLDQTVALRRTRLFRQRSGLLGIERCFRFEFSETGNDRNLGEIRLRRGVAISLVLEGASMGRVVLNNEDRE